LLSDEILNIKSKKVIQGWKCKHCRQAFMDKPQTELLLSDEFYFGLFKEDIEHNGQIKFQSLSEIQSKKIGTARNRMITNLGKLSINKTFNDKWLWNCPKCKSRNISIYRWTYNLEENKLIDSSDNLRIFKQSSIPKMTRLTNFFTF
jgi:ribosomal protein S17E